MNAQPDLRRRGLWLMPVFGFASGLPLALTAGTLQAWLTQRGLSVETIALFTAAGVPYTFKFLWSPLLDRYALPWLGRRRGWLLLAQLCLMMAIAAMPMVAHLGTFALLAGAFAVAFFSATQDIVLDAYRTEVLLPDDRSSGAAWSVNGYRVGMLVSGAIAMAMSEQWGWTATYTLMAGLMSAGIIATLLGPEPGTEIEAPRTLADAVILPFREFLARSKAVGFIVFIALYKLADALAGSLTVTFLIGTVGFTATEVGFINKGAGFVGTVLGAIAGGVMSVRIGLIRSLFWCGILQAATNLGYVALAMTDKNYVTMAAVVAGENFAGGMGTTVFVTLLTSLCDHRYTATQYALLSAASTLGRNVLGPLSGYFVRDYGWPAFFAFTVLTAIPGLLMLYVLRRELRALDARGGRLDAAAAH